MTKSVHILLLILITFSCTPKKKETGINWNKEIIGVGYAGWNKDSLTSLFFYFPCEGNQPERTQYEYKFWPTIKGDTILFPNRFLRNLLKEKIDATENFIDDSTTFLISQEESLIQFNKISGSSKIPSKLYFKKYSNDFPDKFSYQYADGMNRYGNHEFEIIGENKFNAILKGSPFEPFYYRLNKLDSIDRLFVNSYLNLILPNRYDTIDFRNMGAIFCGVISDEKIVYNDSVFEYSTYFTRYPGSDILLHYLRSKVNMKEHGLKDFDSVDKTSLIKSKDFNDLPVAIEKVWF